jgi:hypothetical protein
MVERVVVRFQGGEAKARLLRFFVGILRSRGFWIADWGSDWFVVDVSDSGVLERGDDGSGGELCHAIGWRSWTEG